MIESDLTKYNIKNNNSTTSEDLINTRLGLRTLFDTVRSQGYRKIILLNGIYRMQYSRVDGGKELIIPSGLTVDMNKSKFKMHVCGLDSGNIVTFDTLGSDMGLINGHVEGEFDEHDLSKPERGEGYIAGEGLGSIAFSGNFTTIENVEVSNVTGYCIGPNISKDIVYESIAPIYTDNMYIKEGNEVITTEEVATTQFYDITKFLSKGWFYFNVYQGYGGYYGHTPDMWVHFYDENKAFIKSVKTRQFKLTPIVNNAKFVRITVFGHSTKTDGIKNFKLHYLKSPTQVAFKNCHIHDTRTCSFALGHHDGLLIKNCTLERVAKDNSQYHVTTVLFDIEDGYQYGRNVYFNGNKNLDMQCAGFVVNNNYNWVFENNINMVGNFGNTKGLCVRNNVINETYSGNDSNKFLKFSTRGKEYNGFTRIHHNNLMAGIKFDSQKLTYDTNFVINDCTIYNSNSSGYDINGRKPIFNNCIFNNAFLEGDIVSNNCTFNDIGRACYVWGGLTINDGTFNTNDNKNPNMLRPNNCTKEVNFNRCKFKGGHGIYGDTKAAFKFNDCAFDNMKAIRATVLNDFYSFEFNNCDISYYSYNGGAGVIYGFVLFDKVGSTSIKFYKCNITSLDSDNNFAMVMLHQNKTGGEVLFEDCMINKTNGYILDGYHTFPMSFPDGTFKVILKNTPVTIPLRTSKFDNNTNYTVETINNTI